MKLKKTKKKQKKTVTLLRKIMSKHHGDFSCLNCRHCFATENKYESHKKVCEDKDFGNFVMPSQITKIFTLHQYQKSDKAYVVYVNLIALSRP